MDLSISSSDAGSNSNLASSSTTVVHDIGKHALPSGLRLTAADRPGVAQPVPERDIPNQPWRTMSLIVLVLVVLLTAGWEWQMRKLELVPGDLSGTYDPWAERRREVDQHNVPVAIVGDSRSLYDTDLDRIAQLTGERPLQLGIAGGSGLPILEDLANDPHFKGLALVGMAETTYFDTHYMVIRPLEAIELSRWESPSKRASFKIQRVISKGLAMLSDDYQLSTLVARLDHDWRPGVKSPYHDIWKLEELGEGGQTWLWRRTEHDRRLSGHARMVWHELFPPFPTDDATIKEVLDRSKVAVDNIRARGGDVVFFRPPSAPDMRAIEDKHVPRARAWDALLAYTNTQGIHIDDLPTVQNLTLPEGSHLTHACATVYTDVYIRRAVQQTSLLHLRPDAPPALSTPDCVRP
jgi:hypothetical protein